MLKIVLLFSISDNILCEMQTRSKTTISQVPSCRNSPLCHLSNTYKTISKSISTFLPYQKSVNYDRQGLNLQRNYNGFGSSILPAYYHAFDPISVLASLAFLAFLLQSFASLFERSRSILPTIINSRHSTMDLTNPNIPRHMSNALQEYENLNKDLVNK